MQEQDSESKKREPAEMTVIALRPCPVCRKQGQSTVRRVTSFDECPSGALLVGKWLFPIPLVLCCGDRQPATLAKLIWTQPEPGESGLLRIGSQDLPVVSKTPSSYAVAISPDELAERQTLWIAQEALWLHYKQEYLRRCQAFFEASWPLPAREMDPWALVDTLASIDMLPQALQNLAKDPAARRHPRGDKKRYLVVKKIKESVVRDYPPTELERFFHATVTAFIHFALLPGIYSGKWDVADGEKRLGPSALTFALLTFPLVDKLSDMRTAALLELAGGAAKESGAPIHRYARTLQKQLSDKQSDVERLSTDLGHMRERLVVAEKKLHESREESRRLRDSLAATQQEPAESAYARKVQALKRRLEDMEAELKALRIQQARHARRVKVSHGSPMLIAAKFLTKGLAQKEASPGLAEDAERAGAALRPVDFTRLAGLTIGIFGGIGDKQPPDDLPCRLILHDAEKEAAWRGSLPQCDVLVVLTRAISHQAMWAIKEHADVTGKPIFYSRHLSIPVILRNMAGKLAKDDAAQGAERSPHQK
ncbi:hypothetical protein GTO89_02140 [Heliobacterium gestii]|uniref:DUF2325 domain-containing protein n=1 Tax=Heliomicrobium gestii TaxID=2699 RepID=A0A845L8B5_HELGE|nr:hypothetical protein [Heliomicrobium gestii]MBM7865581.1 hypothetical protein [Heliomicrobium gestii]MZP41831.1 hypothetical protein [Heliomicrobium gestii]